MLEANPFQDPLRFERRVPPCAIVIFGANGDLTKRKLIPALYRLAYDRRLPPGFAVIGTREPHDRRSVSRQDAGCAHEFLDDTPFDEHLWADFAQSLSYFAGDLHDPDSFTALAAKLMEVEEARKTEGNVLFYLSTQPSHYEVAIQGIGYAKLATGAGWRRIVVEKPFGHDLSSAHRLNVKLHEVFPENEVYRIDHYLGQGDCPERAGISLRQWNLRAALESPLRQ
jgi:Glucose-6-phosphate 1-dehydrogenase